MFAARCLRASVAGADGKVPGGGRDAVRRPRAGLPGGAGAVVVG